MRQFLKFTLASCLGVFLAFVAVGALFMMIAVSAAVGSQPVVKSNSVLDISLDYSPPEQTNNTQQAPMTFKTGDVLGVRDIVRLIEYAATDDKIQGIYFDPSMMYLGPASASDVADALTEFRDSGKFVLTYGNFFEQGGYYLASASDSIILNPIGSVDFRGFSSLVPFYKEVLDKTGIKMQIYYAGQFKSATEPFRRTDMSPQSKLQTREYLEEVYGLFLDDIAENRGIEAGMLREIAEEMSSTDAEAAKALGLVDMVGYEDDAHEWMRRRMGIGDSDADLVEIEDYHLATTLSSGTGRDRIALVMAEGAIVHGESEYGNISDGHYVEMLRKVRQSDRVKAVVLRVNSPGGNILAAENILREVKLIQEAGKPVVVSMGDYAASGGYYISASADSIFAESNTLTGSIGVFTMIPNPHQLLTDKLGIHFDTVRTAEYSASFTPFFDWSDEEHGYFKKRTDDFYSLFLEKVADGRNMSVEDVDKVAQGRIWTGQRALEHGLVDEIGGLPEAIEAAASLADLEDYRVSEYPKLADPWTRFINELTQTSAESKVDAYFESKLQEKVPHFDAIRQLITTDGPVARLPVIIEF